MGRLIQRLAYLVQRNRHARNLDDEMDFHRWMLERHGASAGDPRERSFGNATLAREEARGVWIPEIFDAVRRDVRYGLRMLRRELTFAFSSIVTLAIRVLTVTTVFTIVDGQLWRPCRFLDRISSLPSIRRGPARVTPTRTSPGPDFFA